MKLKQMSSAVLIHVGACLIAFLALGSAAPEATSTRGLAKPEKAAAKPAPTPLPSMNSFRTEARDLDSEKNEASETVGSSGGSVSGATRDSKN